MQVFFWIAFFGCAVGSAAGFADDEPAQALKRLMEGNQRYVKDRSLQPDRNAYRRAEVASQQTPFAAIVGCSDSRVPPEIVFDQGIGDLFVVRVAGNVVGPLELDSLEYAAEYLKASAVLVLGHEECGAVGTVLKGEMDDIEDVAQLIQPAIQNVAEGDVAGAVKANVRSVVQYLKRTTLLKRLIDEGKMDIFGGYYHLRSGKVDLLSES